MKLFTTYRILLFLLLTFTALAATGDLRVAAGAGALVKAGLMPPSCGQPGSLDPYFGNSGKAITDVGGAGFGEIANAVAVQADGKIVAAGYAWGGVSIDIAVLRYNADGTLDATFGGDGRVLTGVGTDHDEARAVGVQADGKIVAAGYTYDGEHYDFAVVRYEADGSLDQTFGLGGRVVTPVSDLNDQAFALALQPDGKIVAAGWSDNGSPHFALVRYNTDGSLDGTFGGSGRVVTQILGGSNAWALALQPDGKIVAAGSAFGGQTSDVAVARYNADGSLDATFGIEGKVTTPIGTGNDSASSVTVQPDGRIVAAGTALGANFDIAIVRYDAAGGLDTTFGTGGKVVTAVGDSDDLAESVAVQPDGRIVAAGYFWNHENFYDYLAIRYTPDGSLDTTFGTGGKAITQVLSSGDVARAAALQVDGKLLIAGSAGTPSYPDIAVVRYSTDGSLDRSFGGVGRMTAPVLNGNDNAYSTAIQADGKIVAAGNAHNGSTFDIALLRFDADGKLDLTFGDMGQVVTPILSNSNDYAYSVAIQADGKIVVAGSYKILTSISRFVLVRYNPDGSLDTTFGEGGIVITRLADNSDEAFSLALQLDGKIVAAGRSFNGANNNDLGLVRYNPDGTLDPSFGNTGIVVTQIGTGAEEAHVVLVQPDGKIVAAGRSFNGSNNDFAIVRYSADGTLDTSFGSGGKVVTPIGSGADDATSAGLQPDGKIVAAGYSHNGANNDLAAVRYNADGSLDASFGSGGRVVTPIGGGNDETRSVAIQADGRIVAGGTTVTGSNIDVALVRYLGDGSLDKSFGSGGKTVTAFENGDDSAYSVALQSDGRIVAAGSSVGGPNLNFALARYIGRPCTGGGTADFDYDGDGRTDISVFRPDGGQWYLQQSTAGFLGVQFGTGTDLIAPADYDGDRRADIAVYRPATGTWYVASSGDGSVSTHVFGVSEDLPVPADYDGDGKADISVFRPSTGTWYRTNSSDGSFSAVQFGQDGDRPTMGDFDGDGRADVAVFRPATGEWYQLNSSDGSLFGEQFGSPGDRHAPADYDGDGKTDIAIYRPSEGLWYYKNSATGAYTPYLFGLAGDVPAAGDYDGDGRADIAVFRPSDGYWYIVNSSTGLFTIFAWGQNGDQATPGAFGR